MAKYFEKLILHGRVSDLTASNYNERIMAFIINTQRGENEGGNPSLENAIKMASKMKLSDKLEKFAVPDEKIMNSLQDENNIDKQIISAENQLRDLLVWFNDKNDELMKLTEQYNQMKAKAALLFDLKEAGS